MKMRSEEDLVFKIAAGVDWQGLYDNSVNAIQIAIDKATSVRSSCDWSNRFAPLLLNC